jgi:hypothetical protein
MERYITVDRFIKYCSDSNISTSRHELEHYEKAGIMLPTVRLIYPEEYVRKRTLWFLGVTKEAPEQAEWPELQRLSEKFRIIPEHYADLKDEELIDSFDREMGKNPYLVRPTPETYKPWDSFNVTVHYQDENQISESTVEHYYSYWQVHQLYFLQQYPDLYENAFFLKYIPDEIKQRGFPRAPSPDVLRNFKGLARMFDALSFWVTVYNRERNRTFALIPEEHHVKHLDIQQHQDYENRLADDARLIPEQYGITIDDLYEFLFNLIKLYNDYREKERYKLSEELRGQIIYQAQLIEALSGSDWAEIGEQIGKRYSSWTKQGFLHLDILAKERDEARDLLTFFTGKYIEVLAKLNITNPKYTFSPAETDAFLDYCENIGLTVMLTALSGMISTEEESTKKFRRVSLYTNIKNLLTTLEFLLKTFAQNGDIVIDRKTLNPIIQKVMKNEVWNSLFVEETKKGFTGAERPEEFFEKFNKLMSNPDLVRTEDTFWARVFLIVSLARNLTVHTYPIENWFYGDLFNEILQATIYAILYSWQTAKREGWV